MHQQIGFVRGRARTHTHKTVTKTFHSLDNCLKLLEHLRVGINVSRCRRFSLSQMCMCEFTAILKVVFLWSRERACTHTHTHTHTSISTGVPSTMTSSSGVGVLPSVWVKHALAWSTKNLDTSESELNARMCKGIVRKWLPRPQYRRRQKSCFQPEPNMRLCDQINTWKRHDFVETCSCIDTNLNIVVAWWHNLVFSLNQKQVRTNTHIYNVSCAD